MKEIFIANNPLMTKEVLKKEAWEDVGDEKLFPNHTDKDIWESGFEAGWKAKQEQQQLFQSIPKPSHSDITRGWDGC